MDLSTDQKPMGIQKRHAIEFGNRALRFKNTLKETDIKENNNLFNSPKAEERSNHGHDPSSLFEVKGPNVKNFEMDASLFSYSSFKKAMDLRTHNRPLDGRKRTIFDDAEHFAKNHRYKLLPISFEQLDEAIIQSEHNYSLFSLTSESEPEENFSRTMDYSQVKEKNYKRRRTKVREELVEGGARDGGDGSEIKSASVISHQSESCPTESECKNASPCAQLENSVAVQPLDLSAAPIVQEEKTEPCLRERPHGDVERNACDNDEVAQLYSDKENLNSKLNGIWVTITRPDEKENYQPCDLFLNDIARLVPWLIDKDCFEVDILDRTCDQRDDFQKHRLYYVISESTWRLFQRTNERIILTNDQTLGQPLRKAEKDEKPSYLVFDQFSLAKCLAEYCQEIGGCFEYTCIEEGKEEGLLREKEVEEIEKKGEASEKESKEISTIEAMSRKLCKKLKKNRETKVRNIEEEVLLEEVAKESRGGNETKAENGNLLVAEPEGMVTDNENERKRAATDREANLRRREILKQVNATMATITGDSNYKATKKKTRGVKRSQKSSKLPRPKIAPSKASSQPKTSQKSGDSVSRKGRRKRTDSVLSVEEPQSKRNKSIDPEDGGRRTRSGKALEVDKTNKANANKKENEELKGRGRRGKGVKEGKDAVRSLRSRAGKEKRGRETGGRGDKVFVRNSKQKKKVL